MTVRDGEWETDMIKGVLYVVGFFALIGLLVVAGCFKMVF